MNYINTTNLDKVVSSDNSRPEIAEQMEALSTRILTLLDLLEILNSKLLPVSRPVTDKDCGTSPTPVFFTPLARTLQDRINQLDSIVNIMQSAITRIEL